MIEQLKQKWEVWMLIVGIASFGWYANAEVSQQLRVIEETAETAQANTEALTLLIQELADDKMREQYEADLAELRALVAELESAAEVESYTVAGEPE